MAGYAGWLGEKSKKEEEQREETRRRCKGRTIDIEKQRMNRWREAEGRDGNVPERWDTRDLCRWLSSEGGLRAAQHK